MKSQVKQITFLMLAATLLGACAPGLFSVAPVVPAPQPTAIPISAVPANTASISGAVWQDNCMLSGGEAGAPVQPSAGCVPSSNGFLANGIRDTGEAGLGDTLISLGYGACGTVSEYFDVRANQDGSFMFSSLPAGTYCVTVDSLRSETSFLLPGQWTLPSDNPGAAAASVTVTLTENEQKQNVNFGWGSQFLPAPPAGNHLPGAGAVNAGSVNLRLGPGLGHRILLQLNEGVQLEILGRSENLEWLLVRLSTGTQGWIFAQYVNTPFRIADLPLKEAYGGPDLPPAQGLQNPRPSQSVLVDIENNIAAVDVSGFPGDTKLVVKLSRPDDKDDLIVGKGATTGSGAAVIHFEMPAEWPDGSPVQSGGLVLTVSSKDGKTSVRVNVQYYQ